jgi:flavorubredoxin
MHTTQQLSQGLFWVGGNDRRIALFENMFPLSNGVSYNSYLLADERIAVLDTVDSSILRTFLENIDAARNGRPVDYLVIHHMEPDHCAGIVELSRRFPHITLVGNAKTFQFIRQFYPGIELPTLLEVKDGDTLSLGRRTLTFITAPMVHWPEVMFSYEESEGILFSADAFGSFGALSGNHLCRPGGL